jgi:hypothetical protein
MYPQAHPFVQLLLFLDEISVENHLRVQVGMVELALIVQKTFCIEKCKQNATLHLEKLIEYKVLG